ncbi:hypothetical protein [Tychonema sp. LEGE 06208]|uniref:hypothetical protein n=1 Tax=Tychonema sp. LEGE 06208 TaxID=1828663 RepID=UPI00187F848F|nr:hypothetical protein [Tychonema sp. LEGE 06208]MBE9163265.1 hypothetical protein [Tychonema sp. LEGE 06208]
MTRNNFNRRSPKIKNQLQLKIKKQSKNIAMSVIAAKWTIAQPTRHTSKLSRK